MYTLSLKREFVAQHHLIGGDWGAENLPHTHFYVLDLRLEGESLNEHGYLVDLLEVEGYLNTVVTRYQDADLNSLTEFSGLNPSLEHFARILCMALAKHFKLSRLNAITVQLWENENAWASYRRDL